MFSDIKVIIWDFDGTLYRLTPEISAVLSQAELATIAKHTGWSMEKVQTEFDRVHKDIPSATATVAKICGISTSQAAFETESLFDRRKYTQRDERIIDLFATLHTYTHIILTNGYSAFVKDTIVQLGLSLDTFVDVVTSEKVGENKPSLVGFKYILDRYHYLPSQFLSIGDRPHIDLVPAKTLGMHTCLVWSAMRHDAADAVLDSVYTVASLLQ